MIRKLGYRPDAHDPRDQNAEERLGAAVPPASATLRPWVYEVLDQGALGSCVANAIMQAVRVSHIRQEQAGGAPNPAPPLGSRLFAYYLSRAIHHQTGEDAGTFLRTCFAALNKFGFPPESVWSYDDGPDKFKRMPATAAMHAAFDQRSPTVYQRISSTGSARVTDIKRAIAAGYPVCFGTDVSTAFASNQVTGLIGPPNPTDEIAGGHALLAVGYDSDAFEVVNSWGEGWGNKGWCRLSPEYLMWSGTRDLWIVESAPLYSE